MNALVTLAAVCPTPPPGAQAPVDQITGYVLWVVLWLFRISMVVALGGIAAGRFLAMPHASKAGIIGVAVAVGCGIAYLVLPGILKTIIGAGCIE